MSIFFFSKQKTEYERGVRLVGSEMCKRDSPRGSPHGDGIRHNRERRAKGRDRDLKRGIALGVGGQILLAVHDHIVIVGAGPDDGGGHFAVGHSCLLYTSDAADEEDSGGLGGPRNIKKKKKGEQRKKKQT